VPSLPTFMHTSLKFPAGGAVLPMMLPPQQRIAPVVLDAVVLTPHAHW